MHATARTAGVVTVVANAEGVAIPAPRLAPPLVEGTTMIPRLLPFVHQSYAATSIARDARGAGTQCSVAVSVR